MRDTFVRTMQGISLGFFALRAQNDKAQNCVYLRVCHSPANLSRNVGRFWRAHMLKGFREFVLRGNVVDLAVGVVIGWVLRKKP